MNALLHTSFRHVTTEQLASAMRQDYYYSYYRENTVLFSAHVADVYGSTVQFATNDSYSVSCIINPSKDIKAGDILRIAAEAYGAERLTQGLLFKQCEVL